MSNQHECIIIFFCGLVVNFPQALSAQDSLAVADTAGFRKYDFFPAISYSPETKLTLGVIGYRYLDLSKADPSTVRSFVNFLAVYTTANQAIAESNWELFTDGNRYRIRGVFTFARFPDRNYGLGNDADALVHEYTINDSGIVDTTLLNYKRFSIMRVVFSPVVLREVKTSLYAGLAADVEYVWDFDELADSVQVLNQQEEIRLLEDNTLGTRSGLGFNLLWDSRDNILNSRKGSFFDLNIMAFGKYLGSDYSYTTIKLDGRTYFNPVSNHSIALRGVVNFRYTQDESLPIRGLSRVGGSTLVRGYFNGTYQDHHMVALESEYRLPFWKDDNLAPFYKFWKRMGMVVFLSGAQVYNPETNFGMDRFNWAAGGGLRILFNDEYRVNLRIDYAIGLSANSNGPGKRQTGLYFFLGEAF